MTNESALAEDILARYVDPASARFDAALEASDLDDATRRELRFWHRQSMRGVRDYASRVLPTVFHAVAEAQAEAHETAEHAAAALAAATRVTEYEVPGRDEAPQVAAAPTIDLTQRERRRIVAARLTAAR